ncbi:DUF1127 domain-containing protein [Pseudomonas sp. TCU-HL1]|uniref:DUF1127 domain-containing protein n=1 Tax=Pseudomonas sp. TCU-HL1 TaxID=1856685 RepID=UPI00083DF531|nr:DUF1127 domain-containing protein [Pseudomonas sp. TCU-HL1]AOE84858.1 hypothetical protein THL1_2310 [Pseudomonas sp. TCU-HL1]
MKGQRGYIGTLQQTGFQASRHRESWLVLVWKQLRRWEQLARQRGQLARMSDEMLKDIGMSRADVMEESERHFWEDPLKK